MSDSDALLPYVVAVVGSLVIGLFVLVGMRSAGVIEDVQIAGEVDEPVDPRDPQVEGGSPAIAGGGEADANRAPAPLTDPARTAIVWTSGGLPIDLPERLRALEHVELTTLVRGGLLELVESRTADGEVIDAPQEDFVIPLDAIAFNPDAYPTFFEDAEELEALQPGQALLSETSAALRGVGAGGSLTFANGAVLHVVGVVPDGLVAGAEVAVAWGSARDLGVARERFMLTRHTGDLDALQARVVHEVVDADTAVRVQPAAGQPVVRHGMDILTQAQVKERFGEFSYRRSATGREILQDPRWREEHIVRRRVPILGIVRCHRAIIDQVTGALTELEERGLAHTVDRSGYAGCWNARLTNRLDALSRHSWGIAIDLNWPDNPVGGPSTQDPELIAVFERWGFAWGGEWLLADPVHFEHDSWPQG
jgi:hypothetical protein